MSKKTEIFNNKLPQSKADGSYRDLVNNDILNLAYSTWLMSTEDQFYFEHSYHTYWCKVDSSKIYKENSKINDARIDKFGFNLDEFMIFCNQCEIEEIGNFTIDFLYFQRDSITEESFYYVNLSTSNKCIKVAISPKALATNSEFKPTTMGLLSGAIFTGSTNQLNALFKDKTHSLKSIETIPYIGYNKQRKAYIFEQYAVQQGIIYEKNEEGYFELPNQINIKSTLSISSFNQHIDYHNDSWLDDFVITFSSKGLVALSFWVGSLFIEQIRDKGHPWPFLTITGQAGAGKSFLIEFLWKLFGRDQYEGENPSSASNSARSRYLLQVSNLPVVFIEGDIDDPNVNSLYKKKSFNFEELKAMFNGRAPRMTAYKTTDNTINNQSFKGGLVISQNRSIEGSEAIESRLIDLYFDKSHHTQTSYISADRLSRLTTHDLSGFLFHVLQHEGQALNIVDEYFPLYRQKIKEKLMKDSNSRIETTHGLMLCYLKFIGSILPLSEEVLSSTEQFIYEMAMKKITQIIKEPMLIRQFWDVYEYLSNNAYQRFNHAKDPNQIAINLNEFYRLASQFKQDLADIKEIQKLLNQSIQYKFLTSKTIRSAITDKTLRCYIFEKTE